MADQILVLTANAIIRLEFRGDIRSVRHTIVCLSRRFFLNLILCKLSYYASYLSTYHYISMVCSTKNYVDCMCNKHDWLILVYRWKQKLSPCESFVCLVFRLWYTCVCHTIWFTYFKYHFDNYLVKIYFVIHHARGNMPYDHSFHIMCSGTTQSVTNCILTCTNHEITSVSIFVCVMQRSYMNMAWMCALLQIHDVTDIRW